MTCGGIEPYFYKKNIAQFYHKFLAPTTSSTQTHPNLINLIIVNLHFFQKVMLFNQGIFCFAKDFFVLKYFKSKCGLQPNQSFITITIQSMFSIWKWQHLKVVNTLARLNTCSIFIWKFYNSKNLCFKEIHIWKLVLAYVPAS